MRPLADEAPRRRPQAGLDRVIAGIGAVSDNPLGLLLLLHANEVVSSDRLIDGLWGERPPATAPKVLQTPSRSFAARSATT